MLNYKIMIKLTFFLKSIEIDLKKMSSLIYNNKIFIMYKSMNILNKRVIFNRKIFIRKIAGSETAVF